MSKKDAIIISVLVNAGLLAVLFVTAIKSDSEQFPAESRLENLALAEESMEDCIKDEVIAESPLRIPLDEVDGILQDYLPEIAKPMPVANEKDFEIAMELNPPKEGYLEVTVKRGDALEKIARAHKASIEEIKKINRMSSDKLKIGQVLRIPQKSEKAVQKQAEPIKVSEEYYIVKSGDNPWKIAKQHSVNFDDLLRLNNLNEEKARNLKAGDKIRVK